jgi:hypothetical protein
MGAFKLPREHCSQQSSSDVGPPSLFLGNDGHGTRSKPEQHYYCQNYLSGRENTGARDLDIKAWQPFGAACGAATGVEDHRQVNTQLDISPQVSKITSLL